MTIYIILYLKTPVRTDENRETESMYSMSIIQCRVSQNNDRMSNEDAHQNINMKKLPYPSVLDCFFIFINEFAIPLTSFFVKPSWASLLGASVAYNIGKRNSLINSCSSYQTDNKHLNTWEYFVHTGATSIILTDQKHINLCSVDRTSLKVSQLTKIKL